MKCPDCGRPMDESMDEKHQYFTCPRCGFEVHRSSWDAMDRYRLKEKCNKYTNLVIWAKLKELKMEKRISTKKMKDKKEEVNELEVDFSDIIANLKLLSQDLLHINEYGKRVSLTNLFMAYIFNDYIAPAVESILKGIEAMEKVKTKEDMGEDANYTHRHDTRVLDEAQNAINARIKEAEDADLDPAMLF